MERNVSSGPLTDNPVLFIPRKLMLVAENIASAVSPYQLAETAECRCRIGPPMICHLSY
jgi:hypothetical protein